MKSNFLNFHVLPSILWLLLIGHCPFTTGRTVVAHHPETTLNDIADQIIYSHDNVLDSKHPDQAADDDEIVRDDSFLKGILLEGRNVSNPFLELYLPEDVTFDSHAVNVAEPPMKKRVFYSADWTPFALTGKSPRGYNGKTGQPSSSSAIVSVPRADQSRVEPLDEPGSITFRRRVNSLLPQAAPRLPFGSYGWRPGGRKRSEENTGRLVLDKFEDSADFDGNSGANPNSENDGDVDQPTLDNNINFLGSSNTLKVKRARNLLLNNFLAKKHRSRDRGKEPDNKNLNVMANYRRVVIVPQIIDFNEPLLPLHLEAALKDRFSKRTRESNGRRVIVNPKNQNYFTNLELDPYRFQARSLATQAYINFLKLRNWSEMLRARKGAWKKRIV